MASASASAATITSAQPTEGVSLVRLYVLRAAYLLLIVGLGAVIVPTVLSHEAAARGVIPSLLCGVWLLAFVGLKYPLRMLPLLMFELAWKTVWFVSFGMSQWLDGRQPPTFAEDFKAIVAGVILMPIVIPWGYVWNHYVKAPGDRWR